MNDSNLQKKVLLQILSHGLLLHNVHASPRGFPFYCCDRVSSAGNFKVLGVDKMSSLEGLKLGVPQFKDPRAKMHY